MLCVHVQVLITEHVIAITVLSFRNCLFLSHFRSEHERHSPQCPFVKGEYTQNVPMCGKPGTTWHFNSLNVICLLHKVESSV